jgi:hypothetical protein
MSSTAPTPRVSVVVNTFNHERFIAQALQSVVNQDFPAAEMEVIVVDDGSTDETSKMVEPFLDRVRYVRKKNAGQVSAFHAGVAEARGAILAFLDGDDWWAPNRLSRVLATFDSNREIGAVGHGYHEVNEAGEITATMTPGRPRKLSMETPDLARASAPFRIFLGTSRFAITRQVLDKTLPVPEDLPFFDNYVFTQAIAISGAQIVPDALCFYRVHSGSLYAGETAQRERQSIRYNLLNGLLTYLPERLAALGVSKPIIAAFLEFDLVDRDRMKLRLKGGWPWETFAVERAAFQMSYQKPGFIYKCLKGVSLLPSLFMPPKMFYRLQGWYGSLNLEQFRRRLGAGGLAVPQVTREKVRERSPSA